MAMESIPWDQRPGYLAAIATAVAPGGLTAYRVPRPVGSSPTDVTAFMPGQAEWAVNNYSEILYQLYPTKAWHDFKKSPRPLQKVDVHGNPMVEPFPHPSSTPRPLLDFPILPTVIGTAESAAYFETVRRWDPRIRWADLTMRMPLSERPPSNTLQMRVSRFLRDNYSLIAWHDASANRGKATVSRDRVLAGLTDAQKAANTTRGSTPGLIDPSLGVAGGVVPYPVLRRGQAQNRKLRKDWTDPATSTQVRQPRSKKGRATHVTSGEKKQKEMVEEEEDVVDGTESLNGTPVAELEGKAWDKAAEFAAPVNKPAYNKRKRSDVDGMYDVTGNQIGRPEKRIRQGSSRADEEGISGSATRGIALDPVWFTDTPIASAPSHHGEYGAQAESLARGHRLNPAYHSNRGPDEEGLYSSQSAMMGYNQGPSHSKRKRSNDVDELHHATGDRSGRPQKRIRQSSSRADREATAQSNTNGVPLDPALFAQASTVPAPPLYDRTMPQNEEYGAQAWNDRSLLNANASSIEQAAPGSSRSIRPLHQHAPLAPLPHLPQTTAMTAQRTQAPSIMHGDATSWNQGPDYLEDCFKSYLLNSR